MIVASGIAMQFGAKPLFENVCVKFGGGNRYGLIGANGCGKSTFMKILGGELEPTAGTVAIDSNERVGRLRQDQFAFEGERVLDVVLMGHAEMWQAMRSRDAIYANPEASEDDFMHAAEFENYIRTDMTAAHKQMKTAGFMVYQGLFGGDGNTFVVATLISNFADLDKGPAMVQAYGAARAASIQQKLSGIVAHVERTVSRQVPELSFRTRAVSER